MIRINLLGAPKPKNKRCGHAVNADHGSRRCRLTASEGPGRCWHWRSVQHVPGITSTREKKDIAAKMTQAEQKNRELADVKARYLERQTRGGQLQAPRGCDRPVARRQNQGGPVNLMTMIGETVNGTEAVWLNTMKDQGTSVDIEGMALSTDAVANLISNLQKTGYFRNVEIKESVQDETMKDMQAFQFTLTCEKTKS